MKIAILPGDGIGPEIVARSRARPRRAATRRPADRNRNGADRRRRLRRGGPPAARSHAAPRARGRCRAAGRRRRAAVRHAAARDAARAGHPRHPQGARAFRQPAPGAALSGACRRVVAEAGDRRRARPHDHPRAHRRHLFRRAARTPHQCRRRGRGLRHDALQRRRNPAHRRGRLRDGAGSAAGSCARSTRPTSSTPASCGARS